jgi:hypothetical protein
VRGAYYVHPEFGYFSPAPRLRRELRIALISILLGMAVGAAIVSIHSGKAVETDSISSNAHLKSDSDRQGLDVAGPSLQFKKRSQRGSCGANQAVSGTEGAGTFEQGCVSHCWDSSRP